MENPIVYFIDAAIKLEYNMAKLYSIFSENLNEDRLFWNRMESEENNHAALLKTARDFVKVNRFPEAILPRQLALLDEANRYVDKCMDDFMANPNRELAFTLGVELEKSAGEAHFQQFMESKATDNLTDIFQKLNQADKDHAARILAYWQDTVLNQGL